MGSSEENHGKDQAEIQLESIKEMVSKLDAEDDEVRESAEVRIHEDPLSVQVRNSEWQNASDYMNSVPEPNEYKILLCWGGPAVRIVGDLDEYNEPDSADIQYQDWFTAWESLDINAEDEEALMEYARQFWYWRR